MCDKYKKSKFNIYDEYGKNDLILYNSLKGVKSIKVVKNGRRLLKWLNEEQEFEYSNDEDFRWLINNGYLVKYDVDEKAIRDAKKAHLLEDNCLYLTIHLTQNCNFRCVYCSNTFTNETLNEKTQKYILSFLQKHIHNYSGVYISWFGGEPLLAINIIDEMSKKIISICEKVKKPYYADVTTNGYLLNYDNFLRLIKCRVREICVTLDGNRDTHNKMRKTANGEDTYERIMDNLTNICKYAVGIPVKVVVRVNLTKESIKNFEKYYNEFNTILGKDTRFSIYAKIVRDWGGEKIKEIKELLLAEDYILLLYKQYINCVKDIPLVGCFEQLEFGGMSCTAMRRNSLVVYTNGMIGKCEKMDKKNNIGELEKKGIDYNIDITETWNGIAYRMQEKCDDCELSTLCFGGTCPRDKILGKNDICEAKFTYVRNILRCYAMLNEGK